MSLHQLKMAVELLLHKLGVPDGEKLATRAYVDERTGGVLPPVTSQDEGKTLTVVDGKWTAV